MGADTKIQWCDFTWNGWIGCSKVSPGCQHCYAEVAYVTKMKGVKWGKGAPRYRTSESYWKDPIRWNKNHVVCLNCGHWLPSVNWLSLDPNMAHCPKCEGPQQMEARNPRVFCASLSDWLDDEVPIEWLADLLKLIHDTPNLDWLLLSKRPQNWRLRIAQAITKFDDTIDSIIQGNAKPHVTMMKHWYHGTPPPNVWIGTTVEDQQRADERIPELLKIPARVRFLSVEPMLGPVDIIKAFPKPYFASPYSETNNGIHWAIFGGESGPNARMCNVEWIRSGVNQCRSAGVAPFVKQLGADPRRNTTGVNLEGATVGIVNAPFDLKDKKGGEITEFPEDLRVREFPNLTGGGASV